MLDSISNQIATRDSKTHNLRKTLTGLITWNSIGLLGIMSFTASQLGIGRWYVRNLDTAVGIF
jgi:hypothetical protein